MIWREADRGEAGRIARFLGAHSDWAMFPLGNLTAYGMGSKGHHQMRFWVMSRGGKICATLGLSAMGMMLPVLPTIDDAEIAALGPVLSGETIAGVIGRKDWAHPLMTTLGLDKAGAQHLTDEPGFGLELADLVLPDDPTRHLRPPDAKDRSLLIKWRAAYCVEILGTSAANAEVAAAADIDGYLQRDTHRLLLQHGVPVAMTGFNAALPDMVQVGGVYTPPEMRGCGHARSAVALHLHEARTAGARRAVLFAANEAAARAYRAIGFRPIGEMTMLILAHSVRIGG